MRKLLYIVTMITLFFLASCAQGPKRDQLQKQISEKLDAQFKQGLFQITNFSRRGSYGYTPIGEQTPKMLLYFKADIKLLKDYKFSNWDGLNVGSLTYILGSTPSGIEGIKNTGNKSGDIITVYGTSNYKQNEKGEWVPTAPIFNKKKGVKEKPKKYVSEIDESKKYEQNLPEYKKSLKILNQIFAKMNIEQNKSALQATEKELAEVLRKARMSADMAKGVNTIATGNLAGNYFILGNALAHTSGKKERIKAYYTSGSVENCNLTEERKVKFSLIQSNIAHMAYKGSGIFRDTIPMQDLRAIGALFPEAIMIVTKQSSHIHKIEMLKNRTISIGEIGSGSHSDAMELIRANKLGPNDFKQILELSLEQSIEALQKGLIDAFIMTGSYPMKSLEELNSKTPIHVISLPNQVISNMTKQSGLIKITIPKKTYKGQTKDIHTVGATALLVTHKDTKDSDVESLLKMLTQQNEQISKESILANYISKKTLGKGVTIPMHPGAKDFFK